MLRVLLLAFLIVCTCATAEAQQPSETLPVSGVLRDGAGAPVVGPVDLTFRIYGQAVAGAALWSETHTGVGLTPEGRYRVSLGSVSPLSAALFAVPDRWLSIEVATDGEMTPRIALSTSPSSHNASLLAGDAATVFARRSDLNDGTPATTPVGWNDLASVPAGFADGTDDVNDADADPTNELQDWMTLPGIPAGFADGTDDVNDADADPTNELQDWMTLPGIPAGFADGTDDVDDADADPTNERNLSLALNGTVLELTDAGGTLTVDLASIGGGVSGRGASFSYPDGLSNIEPLTLRDLNSTPYVVPAGKNLYLTNFQSQSGSPSLSIDGVLVASGFFNYGASSYNQHLDQPLIAGEGQTVGASSNVASFNAFLVDAGVTPVTRRDLSTTPYVVPAGQILVITNIQSQSGSPSVAVDGVLVASGFYSYGASSYGQAVGQPIVVDEGQTVSASSNVASFNGYLRSSGAAPGGGGARLSGDGDPGAFNRAVLVDSTPQVVPAGMLWKVISFTPSSTKISSATPTAYNLAVNGMDMLVGHSAYGNSGTSSARAWGTFRVGSTLPLWLPAGSTLAAGAGVDQVCVVERDLVGSGFALELGQVLLVTSSGSVPPGKVWKVESFFPTTVAISSATPTDHTLTINGVDRPVGHSAFANSGTSSARAWATSMAATTLPLWLPEGTTLAPGPGTAMINVLELDLVP